MSESNSEAGAVNQSMPSTSASPATERVDPWPREALWREYLERTRLGDQEAFGLLYDESSPLVYGIACRILGNEADAQETTLDVYTQVWRDAAKFSAARGTVSAWLALLARSRAIDRLRRGASKRRAEAPLPATGEPAAGALLPDEPRAACEQKCVLEAALSRLAPEQREAVEIAFFEGLSHTELAARLGAPLGTVKTRIRLGMMKLRELLDPAAHGSGKIRRCQTGG